MSSPYPDHLTERVRREVVEVHDFIQAWIRGDLDDDEAVWRTFADRFARDFAMIPPGGALVPPGEPLPGVRAMWKTNPEFRIWTRDHEVLQAHGELVVARYTEWQEGARHTAEAANARWSTVVFGQIGDDLLWHWLHETWMPGE